MYSMNSQSNRRQFLKSIISIGIAAPSLTAASTSYGFLPESWFTENERWLSAQGNNPENYGLGFIEQNQYQALNSKFRGHGLCQNPSLDHQVVMFSRRPGTTGLVVNTRTMEAEITFESEQDHHMHGHGCFSADGLFLFTAESNYKTGQGVITIRDTKDFKIIKTLSSYGIGPHEIALMPDNTTLVIANGGLLTHPESGRKVLNLETMQFNLSFINWHNGKLLKQMTAPEPKASIRHLDVAPDGTVAIAMQVQRNAMQHNKLVPLAAVVKPSATTLTLLHAPEPVLQKMNDYVGSIRINSDTSTLAMTSPKGDVALFYDLHDTKLKDIHAFHDVCGLTISTDKQYFILSNSAGKIRHINSHSFKELKAKRLHFPNQQWDNHMITLAHN